MTLFTGGGAWVLLVSVERYRVNPSRGRGRWRAARNCWGWRDAGARPARNPVCVAGPVAADRDVARRLRERRTSVRLLLSRSAVSAQLAPRGERPRAVAVRVGRRRT